MIQMILGQYQNQHKVILDNEKDLLKFRQLKNYLKKYILTPASQAEIEKIIGDKL